jgi:hypothetical protein
MAYVESAHIWLVMSCAEMAIDWLRAENGLLDLGRSNMAFVSVSVTVLSCVKFAYTVKNGKFRKILTLQRNT